MPDLLVLILLGTAAGAIASAVMNGFQAVAAGPFGQTSDDEPATVKFADLPSKALTGEPITRKRRALAGQIVHYATGLTLGVIYVVAAAAWPTITLWFGVAYGLAVAVALDYVVVPALGLGPPAWKTPPATHAYGLISHGVFGAALQAVRELGFLLF